MCFVCFVVLLPEMTSMWWNLIDLRKSKIPQHPLLTAHIIKMTIKITTTEADGFDNYPVDKRALCCYSPKL